jgi:tetratricopeptide (TPR) repeat protein
LFLYDNGEGCANLREYLPLEGTQGRALITTREQVGLAIAKAVDVKIFTKEDALAFMQLRLGDAAKDGGTELARALGRLPLALEQAAAYVLVTPCTIAKYLDLLEQYGLDVLEEPSQDTDYDQTVMTTWQITLEKLDSDAEALIMLFAYCAPENIPLQIFIDGREYLPDILKKVLIPNNILAQNALIKKLMRYVLVARENDDQNRPLLSMHSLMQQVLQRNTWALLPCLLVARSASNYSFDTREGFATFSQTWPHAVKIAEKAEMHWVEDEDIQELVAYIYHQAGYGLQQQCDYPQALEWYKKALIIREKVFGKEHQSTAGTCNNIAGIYRVQGKFVEALAGYHYVLDFCEKVLGMEDRYTAITYNNIAGVHDNLHEYTEALEWMKKALAIQEKFAGVERSDTASTYNNIAGIHYALHEYHQALAWNRKALAIREEVLGKEHPSTAITYHNIAEAWAALKKPYKALKWCRKALNIRDKVLGKEHLDTAMTYNSLAHLYYQLGNPNDAAPLLRKAYRVFLRKLGVNHHYTQSTLESARNAHNLAQIPTPFEEWLNQPEPESNC